MMRRHVIEEIPRISDDERQGEHDDQISFAVMLEHAIAEERPIRVVFGGQEYELDVVKYECEEFG